MANRKDIITKLPEIFRTPTMEEFFDATVDQVFSDKKSFRSSGYIGRRVGGRYDPINDYFVPELTKNRTWWQLEPVAYAFDSDSLEQENHIFFEDLVNRLAHLGANVGNLDRMFDSEYYSWSPPINADMYINYQNYYWIPGGLPTIEISGINDSDVESLIIGQEQFNTNQVSGATPEDLQFSTGMAVQFVDSSSYNKRLNVEYVGRAIELLDDPNDVLPIRFTRGLPWDNDSVIDNVFIENAEWDNLAWDNVDRELNADYITIERGSENYNAWSRTNRWYHVDVVNESLVLTDNTWSQLSKRATRPILEFEKDLELFKSGQLFFSEVDYLVDSPKSVDEEGNVIQYGWYDVDNQSIYDVRTIPELADVKTGDTLLFKDDTSVTTVGVDVIANERVWSVSIDTGTGIITLSEHPGSSESRVEILENDIVLIVNGKYAAEGSSEDPEHRGFTYYWTGENWEQAFNTKVRENQPPLFQLYDYEGNALDSEIYPNSIFNGSEIFSYKINENTEVDADTVLGFALSYKDLGTISDIIFENDLITDRTLYVVDNEFVEIPGFYYYRTIEGTQSDDVSGWDLDNSWHLVDQRSDQSIIDRFVAEFDGQSEYRISNQPVNGNKENITVFINGEQLSVDEYDYYTYDAYEILNILEPRVDEIVKTDVIEAYTLTYELLEDIAYGYWEIPQQLTSNPKNVNITEYSISEFTPHFASIIINQDGAEGDAIGQSNNYRDSARDLSKGKLILHNKSPLLKTMFITSDDLVDIIPSIRYSKQEYALFKSKYLTIAKQLIDRKFLPVLNEGDLTIDRWVEEILNIITISKEFSESFAYSYMIARGEVFTNLYATATDNNGDGTLDRIRTNNTTRVELPENFIYVYYVSDDNEELLLLDYEYQIIYDEDDYINIILNSDVFDEGDEFNIRIYNNPAPAYVPATPAKLGCAKVYKPELVLDTSYSTETWVIIGHDGSKTVAFGQYFDDGVRPYIPDYRDALLVELEERIYNNIDEKFRYEYIPPVIREDVLEGYFRTSYERSDDPDVFYTRDEYLKTTLSYYSKWTASNNVDGRTNEFYDEDDWKTWNYSTRTGVDGDYLPGYWRGIYRYYYDTDSPHERPWEMLGFSQKPEWWDAEYGTDYSSNNTDMWIDLENGYIRQGPRQGYDYRYERERLIVDNLIPVDSNGELRTPSDLFNITGTSWDGIDADWKYGDNAPVEESWYTDSEYHYDLLEAIYLTRPSDFGELLWDPKALGIDHLDQLVDEVTHFRVTDTGQIVHGELVEDRIQYRSGYQQFISDRLLFIGKNITKEFGDKIRSLTSSLGYKLGGFTDKDSMRISLESAGIQSDAESLILPTNNYVVNLYYGKTIQDYAYSGVVIRALDDGTFKVYGYDLFEQAFRVKPRSATSRVIQISEGGTPANFRVFKFNDFYRSGEYVKYTGNFYQSKFDQIADTFDSDNWIRLRDLPQDGGITVSYKPDGAEGEVELVPYATILETSQEVFDFLISYGQYLTDDGWEFEKVDEATNVREDWLYAAKQFLFWVTNKWQPGNTLFLSPGSDKVKLTVRDGYPSSIERFNNGVYSILNADGTGIDPRNTNINRKNREIEVIPEGTRDGIYYLKVSAKQTEHILIVDNISSFGDIVYDPVLNVRQARLKFTGTKTGDWYGKYEASGYLILDNKLLPSIENAAESFKDYYNTETFLDNVELENAAKHLLGYENREYLARLELEDDVQFNYYQGFVREKGTANSISKIFRSKDIEQSTEEEFYEEWAFRMGRFGSVCENVDIEFLLEYEKVNSNPQIVRFKFVEDDVNYVDEVKLFNAVEVYEYPPIIEIDSPELDDGERATAVAILNDDGHIGFIEVTDTGSGYIDTPDVTITRDSRDTISAESNDPVDNDRAYAVLHPNTKDDDPSDNIVEVDIGDRELFVTRPEVCELPFIVPFTEQTNYFTPNAGYVHLDDVDRTVFDISELRNLWDIEEVDADDRIWMAKNDKEDWAVYYQVDTGAIDPSTLRAGADAEDIENVTLVEVVASLNNSNSDSSDLLQEIKSTRQTINDIESDIDDNVEKKQELEQEIERNKQDQRANSRRVTEANRAYQKEGNGSSSGSGDITYDYIVESVGSEKIDVDKLIVELSSIDNSIASKESDIARTENELNQAIAGSSSETNLTSQLNELNSELNDLNNERSTTLNELSNATQVYKNAIQEKFDQAVAVEGEEYASLLSSVNALIDEIYDAELEGKALKEEEQDLREGKFDEDGNLEEEGLEQVDEKLVALRQALVANEKKLADLIAELRQLIDENRDDYFINDDDIDDIDSIEDLDELLQEELAVIDIDSTKLIYDNASLKDIERRYLDTLFFLPTVTDTQLRDSFTSKGLINIKIHSTNEDEEDLVLNKLYRYIYSSAISSDDTNTYLLLDMDGNFIKYEDEFGSYTSEQLNSAEYYYFVSLRFKNTELRDIVNSTTDLVPDDGFVWVDDVDDKWEVQSIPDFDVYRTQEDLIDSKLYQNVTLRDPIDRSTLITLPIYDPFKELIPGQAEQNIDLKSQNDPTDYTNSDDETKINADNTFGDKEVGKLWWDMSSVRYLWYEQSANVNETDTDILEYRRNYWGSIFPGSQIDIYEWVVSDETPDKWTLDGTPKSETDYVEITVLDTFINRKVTKYYFWVKDRTTKPDFLLNRTLSAISVRDLLLNPRSQDFKWAASIQGTDIDNSFILSNVGKYIDNDNVNVHILLKTREEATPEHSQWLLMSEGNKFSKVPNYLWEKMADSLVTYSKPVPLDEYEDTIEITPSLGVLPVPNNKIPEEERYGIEIRPQQSMFHNVREARRVFKESTNTYLAQTQLWITNPTWNNEVETQEYWEEVDWYEEGYNQFNTQASRQVNNLEELEDIKIVLRDGELVKVFDEDLDEYFSVYEYDEEDDSTFIVRRENGTIRIKDSINIDINKIVLRAELRQIINALRTEIFVGDEEVFANLLFFAMVNYSFSEQYYIDWAFKTTYIIIIQDIEQFSGETTIQRDTTDELTGYISEAKPYHTKLRNIFNVYDLGDDLAECEAYDDAIGEFGPTCVDDLPVEECQIDRLSWTYDYGTPVYEDVPPEYDGPYAWPVGWNNNTIEENLRYMKISVCFGRVEQNTLKCANGETTVDDDLSGDERTEIIAGGFKGMWDEGPWDCNESIEYVNTSVNVTESISQDPYPWDNLTTNVIDSDGFDDSEEANINLVDNGYFLDDSGVPEELVPTGVAENIQIVTDMDVYKFADDLDTIQISYRSNITNMGYTDYIRLSDEYSTTLVENVTTGSNSIKVIDSDKLQPATKAKPGVIWINNERIEYRSRRLGTLSGITRGTQGTVISDHNITYEDIDGNVYDTKVYDGSHVQNVPHPTEMKYDVSEISSQTTTYTPIHNHTNPEWDDVGKPGLDTNEYPLPDGSDFDTPVTNPWYRKEETKVIAIPVDRADYDENYRDLTLYYPEQAIHNTDFGGLYREDTYRKKGV